MTAESPKTTEFTGRSHGPSCTPIETDGAEFASWKAARPLGYLLRWLTAGRPIRGYLVARDEGIAVRDLDVTAAGEFVPVKYPRESSEPRAARRSTKVRVVVDAD